MNASHDVSERRKMIKLAVALIAAVIVGVMWGAVPAVANPPYVPQGPFVAPVAGPLLPAPTQVPGKEFSSHSDRDHYQVGSPEQVLNWDGAGGTYNGWNYTGSRVGSVPPDQTQGQVDALANSEDSLFHEVINDSAQLLFSVNSPGGAGPGFDQGANVFYEQRIVGGGGVWADQTISQPDGAPGSDVNVGAAIYDLDGLEVWGPEPPYLDDNVPDPPFIGDANRYSLGAGSQADPLGVSVWDVSGGGPAVALWSRGEISTIIQLASGLFLNPSYINVDGLMTFEQSEIMFSIDPAGAFDGGEIFVGTRQGGPGSAILTGNYLWHGGHLWDTAFDVMGTFGLLNENVDALEAVSTVPEPATLALFALALLGLAGWWRRGR